jgi:hypothetical protein
VAFGFFNIESDMLLLEHYFFFAEDFCGWISDMAQKEAVSVIPTSWPVFDIPLRENIGDLMGAIHGVHFTGFIGKLYQLYPFPANQEDFKQNPDGDKTRREVEALIKGYADEKDIPVLLDTSKGEAVFGEYCFSRPVFHALLSYVWQGGYPRWRDETPPAYVRNMKEAVEEHSAGVFEEMAFC